MFQVGCVGLSGGERLAFRYFFPGNQQGHALVCLSEARRRLASGYAGEGGLAGENHLSAFGQSHLASGAG